MVFDPTESRISSVSKQNKKKKMPDQCYMLKNDDMKLTGIDFVAHVSKATGTECVKECASA